MDGRIDRASMAKDVAGGLEGLEQTSSYIHVLHIFRYLTVTTLRLQELGTLGTLIAVSRYQFYQQVLPYYWGIHSPSRSHIHIHSQFITKGIGVLVRSRR